ncbi:MAG: PadR family transcriptional regulator [Nanoarchaeota archaeon]
MTIYVLYSIKRNPKTGYEILSEIRQKCGDKWSPSKGSIYPLLKQLEKENLIRIKNVGLRSKNVFEISPKGKKFLSSMHKGGQKLRERFSYFRNLLADIMGEENVNITGLILDIKETSLTKTKKEEVKKILENCLSELKRVE